MTWPLPGSNSATSARNSWVVGSPVIGGTSLVNSGTTLEQSASSSQRLRPRQPEAARRDDVAHHFVRAGAEGGHDRRAVALLDPAADRRTRLAGRELAVEA